VFYSFDLSQPGDTMQKNQLDELLYQALETEKGGVEVYKTAIQCAIDENLKQEWLEYLEQTENHERILLEVFEKVGLDPETQTTGRRVVRSIGQTLVKAMETAMESGEAETAQLVAAECVVQAETKDHLNWELIGQVVKESKGTEAKVLREAYEEVEEEEDEHLYHTTGWARELWIDSLGLPAVIPPPEEEKEVTTAIGAARAKQGRKKML
jgi:rubrerythrin